MNGTMVLHRSVRTGPLLPTPAGVHSLPVALLGWRRGRGRIRSEARHAEDPGHWIALARRIEQGNREAEADFAQQFYVRVRPFASVHLDWSDAAQDIAQETILAALEALRAGKLREPEKLPAFVLGIARNLINNYKRKQAHSPEVLKDLPDLPARANLDLTALDEQQRAMVRESLKWLNQVDRRILLLTLIEGLTPHEIAPLVGLTPQVVRTRKSRAVKALARDIEAVTRTARQNHVL
jgi:RNA polymerase sigma factor (sigma-70 family)